MLHTFGVGLQTVRVWSPLMSDCGLGMMGSKMRTSGLESWR
jgi:hypothetical protein